MSLKVAETKKKKKGINLESEVCLRNELSCVKWDVKLYGWLFSEFFPLQTFFLSYQTDYTDSRTI